MEKIYYLHKLVGLQLFWSRTPTFSSGTPTFCQMGVLNSCFQNPSESSGVFILFHFLQGLKTTLRVMDEECPREENSISNRQLLVKELHIEKIMKRNKASFFGYYSQTCQFMSDILTIVLCRIDEHVVLL